MNINTKREYRVIKKGKYFYPQVRFMWKNIFWCKWYRIGTHTQGYGLYDSFDHGHENFKSADLVVSGHETWYVAEKCAPISEVIPCPIV